jgi:hypothetical protein
MYHKQLVTGVYSFVLRREHGVLYLAWLHPAKLSLCSFVCTCSCTGNRKKLSTDCRVAEDHDNSTEAVAEHAMLFIQSRALCLWLVGGSCRCTVHCVSGSMQRAEQ